MASNPIDGGGEGPGNWDRFGGGIVAPRKPAVYNPDGEKVQPEMSDKWSDEAFYKKDPDITEVMDKTWK